jgi:uncharacterized protein YlxW (UPF0749 family)
MSNQPAIAPEQQKQSDDQKACENAALATTVHELLAGNIQLKTRVGMLEKMYNDLYASSNAKIAELQNQLDTSRTQLPGETPPTPEPEDNVKPLKKSKKH